jgi:predicted RNA-binding Zn ribbon-like protein
MANGAGYEFEFSGGALCLDFVNTISDRAAERGEHLNEWPDLVSWAEQAQIITRTQATQFRESIRAREEPARREFHRALELRESLFRIFGRLSAGRPPASDDVGVLNAALGPALAHARVESRAGRFVWAWTPGEPTLARLLWPVLRSAADLLVSDEGRLVRECASETCSWLFVDRSRTHKRRWCSMSTCGNRDKVRRFYARQRGRGGKKQTAKPL